MILGSGSIGFAVAKELRERDRDLIIVDRDNQKVETLREEAYEAIVGDIADINTLKQINNTRQLSGILILSSDNEVNKKALSNVREIFDHDIFCVVRASDVINRQEMAEMGADLAFMPSKIVAKSLSRSLERAELLRHGNKLAAWFREKAGKRIGIVVHDNPDPDAIASALAIRQISEDYELIPSILYKGEIGHQENKAFVNLLGIDLTNMEDTDTAEFDEFAMVDCSVPGANNLLRPGQHVGVVIDHHPVGDTEIDADFIDIRPTAGATATILTKYLQELNIEIGSELATALLYGIRTDTLDFKRNTESGDLAAAAFLYPLADHEVLDQLERPSMSIETLDIMGEAIKNRQVAGSYLLSNVGTIRDRDTLPQAADYLLNLEGISTTVVFGVTDEKIYVSGRSNDIRINLGEILKKTFTEGSAGGHSTAAAAQIPLGVFRDIKDRQTLLRLVDEAVAKKFLSAVGVEEADE
jgi:nanoRNase/pAp phosphatase (c-di-AMP/oligoRNAs hydrolase)